MAWLSPQTARLSPRRPGLVRSAPSLVRDGRLFAHKIAELGPPGLSPPKGRLSPPKSALSPPKTDLSLSLVRRFFEDLVAHRLLPVRSVV